MMTSTGAAKAALRINVGVSLYVRKGEQSLWENGIFQNCLFLVTLLQRLPNVDKVFLVAGGDGSSDDARNFLGESPVPIIDMNVAADSLDLMIEMSAQLDIQWIIGFRARGGKVVTMRVGNDYVIDCERMVFDKPNGLLISGAPYDEIWTLPQYERTAAPYYQSAMRAAVRIVPHLWSPAILEREVAALPADRSFGYKPGRRRWRAGIFEPNICMVKTAFIPLLCCDVAHRANPDMLEKVWAYNTFHMKEHAAFNGFAHSLDIVRHGLASFEGRFPFVQIVSADVDVVVSHHWENAQNYVYYEALYGTYPLIHNSDLLGDCGYRYREFDCEEGGRALMRAFADHDRNLDTYRRTAHAYLRRLDPEYDGNVRVYADVIDALYANHSS